MNSIRTALVVDDDQSTRLLLEKFLQRQGYEVDLAADGEAGIAMLTKRSYPLVMLDLMMPRVDGLGVLSFLREHRPEQIQRVIIITAYPRQLSVDPGVCAIVSKPFTIQTLRDVLRNCA
ncbi:MAG: response regulator [Thermoanaerobaculia bacterium]